MDGTAIVLCDGYFATNNAKTAHGLVRGTERYRILGVLDAPTAGRDAGEVLDGVRRGIPVFASLSEALAGLREKPDYAIVGVATSGGVFTPGLERALLEAVESGLSIVNGLHHLAADLPAVAEAARRKGVTITDVRRPKKAGELHFWTGEVLRLPTPRIAILGTDCALGKRTTTRMLAQAARAAGIRTEWIYTGQTGWLQGAPFGFVLDATPNDFVSGELEQAILSCARALSPELILIEGQSALRNPSGPCGSEALLSGGARGVILQHAPHRHCFEGLEDLGCVLPPVAEEIELIGFYGARTLGMALNGEGLTREALAAERGRLERALGIPVALPLEEGVERLLPAIRKFLAAEAAA
ncbi:MAG TPA: DUF1611 domain-containing protein [Thermoanaerobaculia bacterium]|nr:DUF1611 domain-containing protein [Thermoanaerobaculia bacterium]